MKNNKEFKCELHEKGDAVIRCSTQCVECGIKELQVEYEQVTSEVDTNKVNAYTCGSCGKNTVVKHRDKGVTPMFLDCIHCGGKAISHMYKVPQDLEHDLVAYVPKNKTEWKLYKNYLKDYYKNEAVVDVKMITSMMQATKQHCKQGGAIMIPAEQLKIN